MSRDFIWVGLIGMDNFSVDNFRCCRDHTDIVWSRVQVHTQDFVINDVNVNFLV